MTSRRKCAIGPVLAALLLLFAPFAARADTRVALVIVNGTYAHAQPLANPVNDGRLIARSLKAAGFGTIVLLENQDRIGMERAMLAFSDQAATADVAMIYYAGHGIESAGENYLIPVDARLERERDLEIEAVKLSTLMNLTKGAKRLRVVVLDACRTPPSSLRRDTASRSMSRGLARIEPGSDSLVVYSAKAGTTAADGSGANSPFATAMARRIVQPGREISLLFRQVRDDVLAATDNEQEPITYGSLSGQEFYFVRGAATPVVVDMEGEAWGLCRDGAGRGGCTAYLSAYPQGKYAALARTRLDDLAAGAPKTAPLLAVRSETVAALGLTVRALADRPGIVVDQVSAEGAAFGQLLPGDVITRINAAEPARDRSPAQQLSGALAGGPVRALVQRGPTTTMVILRAGR